MFSTGRLSREFRTGFDEDPPDTWWAKWFSGVTVPLAFMSYAVYGGISGGMWLP